MIQKLSRDQQRYVLGAHKKNQETVQPRNNDLYENCVKVTSLKCPLSKQTRIWTETTRIPTEGVFLMFRILINAKVASTISSLINCMKSGLWELFL